MEDDDLSEPVDVAVGEESSSKASGRKAAPRPSEEGSVLIRAW